MPFRPVPDDDRAVTPYLIVPRVAAVIDFLDEAFGATEVERQPRPDGGIMHAEMRIGDSPVMLGEPCDEWGPMPASIYLYVDDCDAVYRRAIDAGGESVMEPTTMHHAGERYGGVKDPGGNTWWVATHIEDVGPAEQARRAAAMARASINSGSVESLFRVPWANSFAHADADHAAGSHGQASPAHGTRGEHIRCAK